MSNKKPKNPAPDPSLLRQYDDLKIFRPLEHNLIDHKVWCAHLCRFCRKPHYHQRGKYRPCLAPYVEGRCPKCRKELALKQILINQGRKW
jgi:hypothetical protein